MCLYPRLIQNKKYTATKKNGGEIPEPKDRRVLVVPVGCGKCLECKKQKGRAWSIRLQEEIRTDKTGQFVTLTFSNESITKLASELTSTGYELDNEIATLATRRFLERWRKKYTKSVKHWLVTELGHNGTENVHIHGIIFTPQKEDIKEIWQYGYVYIGDYVNEKTVNYCIKYSIKTDPKNKEYNAKILTSPGIGVNYTKRLDAQLNKYNPKGETDETYKTRTGHKMNLPVYWRNKIYTEEEREKLWLEKLDKKERWVDGTKISIAENDKQYRESLKQAQIKNKRLGYGKPEKWEKKMYENQLRQLKIKKRIQKEEPTEQYEEHYGFKLYKKKHKKT